MSKVDQYIVYQDDKPHTVWGYRDQAYRSAARLAVESRKAVKVMKHYARGGMFLIHTVLPPTPPTADKPSKG